MISHGGRVKVTNVDKIFRTSLTLVFLVLWLTIERAKGWLIMNKEGALSFIAPLEIDAAHGSSKLTFKAEHEAKWDIYLDESGNLRLSELVQGRDHVVITTNNIFSIQDSVKLLSRVSIVDITQFGFSLFLQSAARLEVVTSVSDFAHAGSLLASQSYIQSGSVLFACRLSRANTSAPVLNFLSLDSTSSIRGCCQAGLALLILEYVHLEMPLVLSSSA